MADEQGFIRRVLRLMKWVVLLLFCVEATTLLVVGHALGFFRIQPTQPTIRDSGELLVKTAVPALSDVMWQAPDIRSVPVTTEGEKIRYGRELIAHTSVYLGPKGKVKSISNGMNCQNCHLKAGTVPFGNNFGRVASSYPKVRKRSGTVVNFEKRINDCFERSLNGQPLEEDSREMQAMVAYLKWVGTGVHKGENLPGFGLVKIEPLDRPADPERGKQVYAQNCAQCHGAKGEGQLALGEMEWIYPPLYGDKSFNIGAGLYRVSQFAAFIKANMPLGVTYRNTILSDEEAWDVAAYVNSMPRPWKDILKDWPDISQKPIDHPFGPYSDSFTEQQHKYGPFEPIQAAHR